MYAFFVVLACIAPLLFPIVAMIINDARSECCHSPVETDGRLWCVHCGEEM